MELEPEAGQGMGFRGEEEGNLGKQRTWSAQSMSVFTHFSLSIIKKGVS